MTTPAPTLDTALAQLRQQNCEDGRLCVGLLATLALDEAALAALLRVQHGVEVIADALWDSVRPMATAPATPVNAAHAMAWVELAGQALLLCDDPWERAAVQAVGRRTGACLALARPGQLQRLRATSQAATPAHAPVGTAPTASLDDSAVVQFVDQAIIHAYADGASDIHFETDRRGVGLKYRLDGVMAPGERLADPQRAEEVISRIKVMAQLDITERRRPQDGRIHWSRPGHNAIDLRVSIMPSIFGEDAVLRLLDKAQLRENEASMSLDVLGFDPAVADTIRALASRPHGMLLITGPTGSGKTTTIYAALTEVNNGLEKIVTIEDPVEYELPGVLQIPVNEQKGLTFATGLRSILRHDPDKILVGEIRDAETAEIAVQSSLTGHLVFTTVHANSLFDVLGRFQHFGIDPFGLASAVNGVVVQRLLRKLCPHCAGWRDSTSAEQAKLAALGLPVLKRLPTAPGCAQCRHSGYKGRFVVAEVHQLSDAVRDMIVRKPAMSELKSLVYLDPAMRLLAQALVKVEQGTTSIEEVARVVGLV